MCDQSSWPQSEPRGCHKHFDDDEAPKPARLTVTRLACHGIIGGMLIVLALATLTGVVLAFKALLWAWAL